MKLLLDEMWSPVIVEQLRLRGHDVVAVVERPDLRRLPDAELFTIAQRESRVIITENSDDFCPIANEERLRGGTFCGLVLTHDRQFSRHDPRIIGRMVTALDRLLTDDPDLTNREHWLY